MKRIGAVLLLLLFGTAAAQNVNVVSVSQDPTVGGTCVGARMVINRATGNVFACADDDADGTLKWTARNPPGATFNVKNYGAVGDGTADDAPAIQRAVEAAEANMETHLYGGGGVVELPPGTYRVDNPIILPRTGRPGVTLSTTNPVTIRGAGVNQTLIQTGAAFPDNRAVIEWDSTANYAEKQSIEDLAIEISYDAAKTNVMAIFYDFIGTFASFNDLYLQRLNLNLRNVTFYGDGRTSGTACKFEGNVYSSTFENVTIDYTYGSGDPYLFDFADGTYSYPWTDHDACSTCSFTNIFLGKTRGFAGRIDGALYMTTIRGLVAIASNTDHPYLNLVNAANVDINGVQFEGGVVGPQILATGSWSITADNVALGCPETGIATSGVSLVNTSNTRWWIIGHDNPWCGFTYEGGYKFIADASSRNNYVVLGLAAPASLEISDAGTDNTFVGFDYTADLWSFSGSHISPSIKFPDETNGAKLEAYGKLTLRADSDNDGTGTEQIALDTDGDGTEDWLAINNAFIHNVDGNGILASYGNLYLQADRDSDSTGGTNIIMQATGIDGWVFGPAGTAVNQNLVVEGKTNDANETTVVFADPTADRTVTIPNKTGTVVTALPSKVGARTYGPDWDAIDQDGDGTPEAWITPSGVVSGDGRSLGIMPIVAVVGDNHGEDWDSATYPYVSTCVAKKVPCSIAAPFGYQNGYDADGDGTADSSSAALSPTAAQIRSWWNQGIEIVAHGAYHGWSGYDTTDGNPLFNTGAGYGRYNTGTVQVTNGSATLTGSSTNWSAGDPPGRFQAKNAVVRVDTDADGTYNDETPYLIQRINSGTSITLQSNWAGSNASGLSYEILTAWSYLDWEIRANTEALATTLGDGYWASGSWVDAALYGPSDDLSVLAKAANRLEHSRGWISSEYYGMQRSGLISYGDGTSPLRYSFFQTECGDTLSSLQAAIDATVQDKGFLWINTHNVYGTDASCTSSSRDLKGTVFSAMLDYLKTQQAAGKLLLLPASQAARVVNLWRGSQEDWNLVVNSRFNYGDRDDAMDGSAESYMPGWSVADSDASVAGFQYTCTGGTATVTAASGALQVVTSGGANCSISFAQPHFLAPGSYMASVEVEFSGAGGSGNFSIKDASADTSDMVLFLQPITYRERDGFGYAAAGSSYVSSPVVGYAHSGLAYDRRMVMLQFNVPANYNKSVYYQLNVANLNGTVRFRQPVIVRHTGQDLGTKWGGGNGLKQISISRANNDVTGDIDAAFARYWIPPTGQRADAPTLRVSEEGYVPSSAETRVTGRYLDCSRTGDLDGDGTTEYGICDEVVTGTYKADGNTDGTVVNVQDASPDEQVLFLEDCLGDTVPATYVTEASASGMTGISDADPATTASSIGACYIDTGTSANAEATWGISQSTDTTVGRFAPTKLQRFTLRLRHNSSANYTAGRYLVGGYATGTDGDPLTKKHVIGFWCDPDNTSDVDGDGTAGDADDNNWWFVLQDNESADGVSLCAGQTGNGSSCSNAGSHVGTYALNTGVECEATTWLKFAVEYNGTQYRAQISDAGTWDSGWVSIPAQWPDAGDLLFSWGVLIDTQEAVAKRVQIDYEQYRGRR